MENMTRFMRAVFWAALLVVSSSASALTYTAYDLGSLGGIYSTVYDINASGQAVGVSTDTNGARRAFITGANGVGMTDLGTLGGGESGARAINASGQVVGQAYAADGAYRAFITGANGFGMTDLGTLGGNTSRAKAINDSGQVVGYSMNGYNSGYRAFITGANGVGINDLLWGLPYSIDSHAEGINAIGQVVGNIGSQPFITGANGIGWASIAETLGGPWAAATAINGSGRVVGSSAIIAGNNLSPAHAFITGANGVGMTDLGTLGGINSTAYDINASGQVAGGSNTLGGDHAFITGANGVGMTDLNSLVTLAEGAYFSDAQAINDLGQIVANASNGHAYLISPVLFSVPEPDTHTMLLAALGLLGLTVRRRRQKQPA